MTSDRVTISVVSTMYRSRDYLRDFYTRTLTTLQKLGSGYEFIFVNDGSPDDSLDVALEIARDDERVRVIDLTRNFGHHEAIFVGLRETRGDYVFLIDCDLEEDPENLEAFYEQSRGQHLDMVFGVWQRTGEPALRALFGGLYYRVFNLLSDHPMQPNELISRFMSRRFVDAVIAAWSWDVPLAPLMASIGFKVQPLTIGRKFKGYTSYSVGRRVKLLVDSVASFSTRPLLYVFLTGLSVWCLSLVFTAYALTSWVTTKGTVDGWSGLFISLWFLGGIVMMSLGVLGIYLGRVFHQVRHTPIAIVRARYSRGEAV